VLGYVVGRNVGLKRRLAGEEVPYVWRAEELARLARKENPGVKVVLNGEKGLWNRGHSAALELNMEAEYSGYPYEAASAQVADSVGNLFLLDREACTISKCTPQGQHLLTFGHKGRGPGELLMPLHMACDPNDGLWVLDAGNRRAVLFSSNGTYLRSAPLDFLDLPGGFAVDREGAFYLSWYDPRTERVIHKYSPDGVLLCSFGEPVRFRTSPSYPHMVIKQQLSTGPLLVIGDTLHYSQRNPYEIRTYTTRGELRRRVFRKNHFMKPVVVKASGNGRYRFPPFSASLFLGKWGDKLVNVASAVPRAVVDVFDADGHLLCTLSPPTGFLITSCDDSGRVYGCAHRGDTMIVFRGRLSFSEGSK